MKIRKYLTEQVFEGETTYDDGHKHRYRVDAIGTGFTTYDDTNHIHSIGAWKVKTSQGHEHQIKDKVYEIKKVKKPDFMTAMGLDPDYTIREVSPDVYQIAKFTHGKEPTEEYRCEWTGRQWKCNCYSYKSCKHITQVQKFIKGKKKTVFDKWIRQMERDKI